MKKWKHTNLNRADQKHLGMIESECNAYFDIIHVERSRSHRKAIDPSERKNHPIINRLVFGDACNTGFIESGYMDIDTDYESIDEALQELHEELETYYLQGEKYCNRIVCNERM
jgi:hypothetical protein